MQSVIKRDYSIDFFRGIAVLSIILIHTAFWSGTVYVPYWFENITLLIDVPVFFFLAGESAFYSFKKDSPFAGVWRLLCVFALVLLFYGLIFWTSPLSNLFGVFTLNNIATPKLPVIAGSYWFLPVYVVVTFLAFVIVKYSCELVVFISLLGLMVFGDFVFSLAKNYLILGLDHRFIFFYLALFLFGYIVKKYSGWFSKNWRFLALLLLVFPLYFCFFNVNGNPLFDLQGNKFPPSLIYSSFSLFSVVVVIILSPFIVKESLLTLIGKKALFFYVAQGISSSLIYWFVDKINLDWWWKLIVLFCINLILASIIVVIIDCVFKGIGVLKKRLQ